MKKVIISASSKLQNEILKYKNFLKDYDILAFPVKINNIEEFNFKKHYTNFYQNIYKADMLLVINKTQKWIENYIWAWVFAEISIAIGCKINNIKDIQIILTNPIPQNLPYTDELLLWKDFWWIEILDFINN